MVLSSSSHPANTVFLSLPALSRRLHHTLFFFFLLSAEEGSVRQTGREREMEKVGGLILAGETFSPHHVFVLALLKHLKGRGREERGGEGSMEGGA